MQNLKKIKNVVSITEDDIELAGYYAVRKAALDITQDFIMSGHIYRSKFLAKDLIYLNQDIESKEKRKKYLSFFADQYDLMNKDNAICLNKAFFTCEKCNTIFTCDCEQDKPILFDAPISFLGEEEQCNIAKKCNFLDKSIVEFFLTSGCNNVKFIVYSNVNRQIVLNRGVELLQRGIEPIDVISGVLYNKNTPKNTLRLFWEEIENSIISEELTFDINSYVVALINHIHASESLIIQMYDFLNKLNDCILSKEIVIQFLSNNKTPIDIKQDILDNHIKRFNFNDIVFSKINEINKRNVSI